IGKADMTQTGTAYIEVEGMPDDIYVSEHNVGNALHGDLVEISIIKVKRNGKPIGKVEKVLERAKTDFVGTIEKSLKYAFLVSDSKRMPVDIFIPLNKLNGAENGEKAIARMTDWPEDADSPFGEVIQVLGKPGENETEMHAILAEYGLPSEFPKHIVQEAEKIDTEIKASEVKKRRDMRSIPTFTIDPVDAKDFDDALSVQKLKNGNWEIGVHIADVSHYLKEGSALDQEAFERATSVYLVDRVVPMLPEVLSNFACSLRPNEDKYCFSAVFELDENTKIVNEWFGRTVINSNRRFAYEDAQKIIESGEGDFSDEILTLDRLAKQMRKDRFKKGAIDFHTLEVKFELDDKGEPLGVFVKEQKDANKLIEEFMLLANKRVATFIGGKQQKKP
ncbi:MAG: RNB domain-containing ribonuclease, partial [Vicingaceae bacterium]